MAKMDKIVIFTMIITIFLSGCASAQQTPDTYEHQPSKEEIISYAQMYGPRILKYEGIPGDKRPVGIWNAEMREGMWLVTGQVVVTHQGEDIHGSCEFIVEERLQLKSFTGPASNYNPQKTRSITGEG